MVQLGTKSMIVRNISVFSIISCLLDGYARISCIEISYCCSNFISFIIYPKAAVHFKTTGSFPGFLGL